ncbi:MAG: hypothetical protein IT258_12625 [Saprospiraceae bacterium]|nr:hypothetical protein [Saprospiraceae bacterium]
MNYDRIAIKVGEKTELTIPNRGSSGLRLVHEISDSSIIQVSREELPVTMQEKLVIKPGDKFPAFFRITGLAKGTTTLVFKEQRVGMPDSSDLVLKKIEIFVD